MDRNILCQPLITGVIKQSSGNSLTVTKTGGLMTVADVAKTLDYSGNKYDMAVFYVKQENGVDVYVLGNDLNDFCHLGVYGSLQQLTDSLANGGFARLKNKVYLGVQPAGDLGVFGNLVKPYKFIRWEKLDSVFMTLLDILQQTLTSGTVEVLTVYRGNVRIDFTVNSDGMVEIVNTRTVKGRKNG